MANIPSTTQPTDTKVFFNGYFSQPMQVSDAVWGQVYGYFYTLTNSSDAAGALAQSVIALTYNNNLEPLTVLQQFQAAPNSTNIKELLISFFNSAKGSTSKLGYKRNNATAPLVSRNIIA
jgi:hypothetical protein